jgi:uncharacterized protein YecT (DUF1311 family)
MLQFQRWLAISGVGFALSTTVVAHAQPLDCSGQELTTIGMTDCAEQRLKRADSDLNQAYAGLMKKIEASDQKLLRTAEKAWISFRDSECSYRIGSGDKGGTLRPMREMRCRAELTEARAKDFRTEIKCQSFDLSCTQD